MMKWFDVVSGQMTYTEPVAGMIGGPQFDTVDFVYVWARTKRDAVRAAVRFWERNCRGGLTACCWPHEQRRDGMNPFTGVTATETRAYSIEGV